MALEVKDAKMEETEIFINLHPELCLVFSRPQVPLLLGTRFKKNALGRLGGQRHFK